MKRCPKCGSGAELINGVEYYASHTGAVVVGLAAGLAVSVFDRNHAGHTASEVHKNLTENTRKKYKCTNPKCNHVWTD